MSPTMQVMVGLNKAYLAKRGGGTIANFSELHLLDTGAIAILDEEHNIIPITAVLADVAKVQKFYIAQGNVSQATSPKVSSMIDRDAYTQWYNVYRAPVLQVWRVGKVATVGSWNLPGTLLNGTYATIVITNRPSTGYTPIATKRYTVPVVSTDTVNTIGAKFVAAINTNPDSIVTASYVTGASDDYLNLVAITVGTSFVVGVDDVIANALRSANGTNGTADNFSGFGTQDKVAKFLMEDAISRGKEYLLFSSTIPDGSGYYTNPDVLDGQSGLTFNGWTFQWTEEVTRVADNIPTANPVVAFFVQVGATGLANITTVINLLLQAPSTGSGASPSGLSSGEGVSIGDIPVGGEG